jgi:hypothetical protein
MQMRKVLTIWNRRGFACGLIFVSFAAVPVLAQEATSPASASATTEALKKRGADSISAPKDYDITKVAAAKISIDIQDASVFQILDTIAQATSEPKAILVNSVPAEAQRLRI